MKNSITYSIKKEKAPRVSALFLKVGFNCSVALVFKGGLLVGYRFLFSAPCSLSLKPKNLLVEIKY